MKNKIDVDEINTNFCSFCGSDYNEVATLVKGVDATICDECVKRALKVVNEKEKDEASSEFTKIIKPQQIKKKLDSYIVGQEHAKKVVSVAVYNHYKRILSNTEKEDFEISKSNILIIGETGSGKTLIAQTISKIIDVPFCIADATVFTQSGYVGEDVESIISRLLQAANYDVKKAERGIVFIDEIDKISRKGDNPSITRDVSGEGVQQAMLKLLEGSVVNVAPEGGRKHPEQQFVKINTKNILFICSGAFEGMENFILNRLNSSTIGYKDKEKNKNKTKNPLENIIANDLKKYGLIPEIIGRLPNITYMNPIDKKVLRQILTEPKNALIKEYKKLFEIDGVAIDFSDKAIDMIVDKAHELKLGARGLRSICEKLMLDLMFETPSKKIKYLEIDEKIANSKLAS